jgi:hypothetical protein
MKSKEDQLQIACVTWFKYQYPDVVILHAKNEGNRQSVVMKRNGKSYSPDGLRNKKMGVLAGTPDLFVMKAKVDRELGNITYIESHGLWIEMKAPGKYQTKEQKEFEAKAIAEGYQYSVCRSVDEFISIVNNYLT